VHIQIASEAIYSVCTCSKCLSRPVRYAKSQKIHFRNICLPFGHTFTLIFYLDCWKLQMTISMNFPIQKPQIHHAPNFVWCHLSVCLWPKMFSSLSTPVTTQNKNNLSSASCGGKPTIRHLFLWTGVMCRRMSRITNTIAYFVRTNSPIPSLSGSHSDESSLNHVERWQVTGSNVSQYDHRSPLWYARKLYNYLPLQYLILQRNYTWSHLTCFF
jgi:hypothetical protein